jgi:hypothetical protein
MIDTPRSECYYGDTARALQRLRKNLSAMRLKPAF